MLQRGRGGAEVNCTHPDISGAHICLRMRPHVTVLSGAVQCWSSTINAASGTVCVASSNWGGAAISMHAVHEAEDGGYSVLSIAKASVTFTNVSRDACTARSLADLSDGAFDESDSPAEWDQVRASSMWHQNHIKTASLCCCF